MILSVINQKGGVAKTTTAQALGAGMHEQGHKVLFIDLDPQGNLTDALQARSETGGAYALLTEKKPIVTRRDYADIISSTPELAGLTQLQPHALKDALTSWKDLQALYQIIIIDTPPALSPLTLNALTASEGVIIPALADRYSLQGIGQLYQTVQAVRSTTNPGLEVLGIVLTRHNPRTILGADVAEVMQETAQVLGTKVFDSTIREAVAIREAQYLQANPFEYAPKSNVVDDYRRLTAEVIKELRS